MQRSIPKARSPPPRTGAASSRAIPSSAAGRRRGSIVSGGLCARASPRHQGASACSTSGIGSMGLYRSLEDELMSRIRLTGISESQQHDAADPWVARHAIEIAVGPDLAPLANVAAASQDRIVCTYVLDYLSDPMRSDALIAFARVMLPGAKLVLVLHHPHGRRANKFRRSRPYWPMAHDVYAHLLGGLIRTSERAAARGRSLAGHDLRARRAIPRLPHVLSEDGAALRVRAVQARAVRGARSGAARVRAGRARARARTRDDLRCAASD